MDEFSKNKSIINQRRKAKAEESLSKNNSLLKRKAEISIRTTMISALEEFENSFGELWGQGKPYNQLTEEELKNRKLWEKTRTAILDRGQNSMEILCNTIRKCTVTNYPDRFKMNIRNNNER